MISLLKSHKRIEEDKKKEEMKISNEFIKEYDELCKKYKRSIAPQLQILVWKEREVIEQQAIKEEKQ